MKSKPVPSEIIETLNAENHFLILGHSEPDGDCVSSQLSLASFLKRLGKKADVFSPGPFQRPEIKQFEKDFRLHVEEADRSGNPLVIVLDSSTLSRTSHIEDEIMGLRIMVIDHHTSGEDFGEYRYIDPSAPSVTFLIQKIIETMGYTPTEEESRLLLFGLCTDTGFFRHLQQGSAPVFEAVSRLVAQGTSTREIHTMIFGGRTFASRKLLGILLARAEEHYDGKLILTWEKWDETETYGIQNRESDTLYQLLQSIGTAEVVALIREEPKSGRKPGEYVSVGLRSRTNYYDVGEVSRSFGGGGHKQAAGFSIDKTVEEIRSELLDRFSSFFA